MIRAKAQVKNGGGTHTVVLTTNDQPHSIVIAPKESGSGSSANGAELLFLALATCYCNDIYREAAKRSIAVSSVQVEVSGEFDGTPGGPASNIQYSAIVEADATEGEIIDLMNHTDTVAEIQNTVRQGAVVTLKSVTAVLAGRAGI